MDMGKIRATQNLGYFLSVSFVALQDISIVLNVHLLLQAQLLICI